MITYGSVCSGIESASVAWEPLGFSPLWFSEIEPFPCSVLKHHWPTVPNFGDMTQLPAAMEAGILEAPDVLVGGTPCQAFSIAGARKGLADERGQLTMTYVELLNAIDKQRPGNECVCVWENVPGVLSSKDNAFGCFLAALCGEEEPLQPTGKKWPNAGVVIGPQRSIAWRILDAQYFGVAQRRRRVFVVASARDRFDPTTVLFESEGMRRDTAPCRETGQKITGHIAKSFTPSSYGQYREGLGTLRAAPVVTASGTEFLIPQGVTIHGTDKTAKAASYTNLAGALRARPPGSIENSSTTAILDAVGSMAAVRRLTPTECERLQGFPDGYTDVPHKGKPAADGPRYKAIGNSKAIPVVKWIGERFKI